MKQHKSVHKYTLMKQHKSVHEYTLMKQHKMVYEYSLMKQHKRCTWVYINETKSVHKMVKQH